MQGTRTLVLNYISLYAQRVLQDLQGDARDIESSAFQLPLVSTGSIVYSDV